MSSLDNKLLAQYADTFYGFGNRNAKIWFIGIEEAGGWEEQNIQQRLKAWERNGKSDLEGAPTFYPASGNNRWHGESAVLQQTWSELMRMLFVARGMEDNKDALLDYQRHKLGSKDGETCLMELLPLPAPGLDKWPYGEWCNLRWLASRDRYYAHLLVARATGLAQRINLKVPAIIIFYGTTFLNTWSCVTGATWAQAIPKKLLTFANGNTTFFVTKHPLDPAFGDARATYFREIGEYFRREHGGKFAVVENANQPGAKLMKKLIPFMPERLDWPSMIGQFIMNFGVLDLFVFDFLEAQLPLDGFAKVRKRNFYERVVEMREFLSSHPEPDKTGAVDDFFRRLEPVRKLRNHFAHGLMRFAEVEGSKELVMTISLPLDMDGVNSPDARHLTFEELLDASQKLTDLIEDFKKLFGKWVTDFEVGF